MNKDQVVAVGFSKLQTRTAGMALHSSNHVTVVNAGFAWR